VSVTHGHFSSFSNLSVKPNVRPSPLVVLGTNPHDLHLHRRPPSLCFTTAHHKPRDTLHTSQLMLRLVNTKIKLIISLTIAITLEHYGLMGTYQPHVCIIFFSFVFHAFVKPTDYHVAYLSWRKFCELGSYSFLSITIFPKCHCFLFMYKLDF
jgi:hypothetical protein